MRTIKITTTLAVFLFIAPPLNAQETTKPFHFPHKKGDMWEYRFSEYGEPISEYDTIQNFTIFDSTDSNGIIHQIQYARRINPIATPYVLDDTTRYWIDTANNNIYGPSWKGNDSVLIYKLNANIGDQWFLIKYEIGGYEMARVVDKRQETVLGEPTTIMRIHYYGAQDTIDTLGLDRRIDVIADGLGLVYRGGAEATSRELNLRGAVINGIFYGDTTLLSVKRYKNILPMDINLYQNYPNPFNPLTTIIFELSQRSNISLIIYDALGKEMFKLIDNRVYNAGKYEVRWNGILQNGNKAASGIYLYRLAAGQQFVSRSMILLK